MLSRKAKYALRALLVLAEHAGAPAPMPISEIADREQISRMFLEAILVERRVWLRWQCWGSYSTFLSSQSCITVPFLNPRKREWSPLPDHVRECSGCCSGRG